DVEDDVEDEDVVNEGSVEPTPPSHTPVTLPPPPQPEHIPSPPQVETAQPSPLPQPQPSQPTDISMTLFNQLLETCTTLNIKVANLEQDKIAQALKITKLKQRVRMLENKRQFKSLWLKRLRKGRLEESQEKVYHLDLEHADKVLKVVTIAANIVIVATTITAAPVPKASAPRRRREVVTIAANIVTVATTITAAPVPKASAPRRRRGVIIQDPEEAATTSEIIQVQIEQDKAFARELEAKLNANINWNDVVDQKAAKKQKIDKETEELKTHLQIVPNDEDDMYT
nr:hypothetical protein [Tanacetum cinerariifolium]